MRGALDCTCLTSRLQWIIPADAGSTGHLRRDSYCVGDHPRGCGEHSVTAIRILLSGGSSPRMRGALPWYHDGKREFGIIPADAGSTRSPCQSLKPRRGSSPRMRGAPLAASTCRWFVRIIPADAGSTLRSKARRTPRTDHPRGCGEHSHEVGAECLETGSSPRMRGAPLVY